MDISQLVTITKRGTTIRWEDKCMRCPQMRETTPLDQSLTHVGDGCCAGNYYTRRTQYCEIAVYDTVDLKADEAVVRNLDAFQTETTLLKTKKRSNKTSKLVEGTSKNVRRKELKIGRGHKLVFTGAQGRGGRGSRDRSPVGDKLRQRTVMSSQRVPLQRAPKALGIARTAFLIANETQSHESDAKDTQDYIPETQEGLSDGSASDPEFALAPKSQMNLKPGVGLKQEWLSANELHKDGQTDKAALAPEPELKKQLLASMSASALAMPRSRSRSQSLESVKVKTEPFSSPTLKKALVSPPACSPSSARPPVCADSEVEHKPVATPHMEAEPHVPTSDHVVGPVRTPRKHASPSSGLDKSSSARLGYVGTILDTRVRPTSPTSLKVQNARLRNAVWGLTGTAQQKDRQIAALIKELRCTETKLAEYKAWAATAPSDDAPAMRLQSTYLAPPSVLQRRSAWIASMSTIPSMDPVTPPRRSPSPPAPPTPDDPVSPYKSLKEMVDEYRSRPDDWAVDPMQMTQVERLRSDICKNFKMLRKCPADEIRELHNLNWMAAARSCQPEGADGAIPGPSGLPASEDAVIAPEDENDTESQSQYIPTVKSQLEFRIWQGADMRPTVHGRPPHMPPSQFERLSAHGQVEFEVGKSYSG
ncbi:hypothetical protein FISHEDRAFT_55747 [Fistulina hepatica ATCC 64428]|uniref:Uncharacterized protein n=1 Tax=Fistulina hepatica ATCC 64428 TaxID=1128425 RepID=A0A0D7AN91_9AGAR|nr:hypothetical protein FISHEDRAFT_55747 [Fistulina hepatica ATCC 64428]